MNVFIFIFYALAVACLLATGGTCRPLAGALVESARAGDQHPGRVPVPARREKRCSCSNMQDTECVYFCHVGIVWVNTPGQVVPYGLGHPVMRRKRELRRCLCTKSSDAQCQSYCRLVNRDARHVRDTRVRKLWMAVGKRAQTAMGEAALQGVSWDVEE